MKVVFQTRFSYFGKSGWRSEASTSPDILFEPERLERRFALFEQITLPSLLAQTDPDFTLMVLSSELMPKHYRVRLRKLCIDTLGVERCNLIFAKPGSAHHTIRNRMINKFGDEKIVTQVVLDDDDAVSMDFVEVCRKEAIHVSQRNYDDETACFLSFPRGYSLGIENQQPSWLRHRHAPFTNLGLALVAPPQYRKTLFGIAHRKVSTRHTNHLINTKRPFYLRTVHDHNDSRALVDMDGILSETEMTQALAYFPSIAPYFETQMLMAAE